MRRFLRFRAASAVSSTYSIEGGRTIGRFHIRDAHKRRGGNLPARLRFSAHRGMTLIELMVSMLILALVCVAWLEIIGIQSAKKEARRREAVERLAGMMDAFMYEDKYYVGGRTAGYQPGYYICSPEGFPLVQPDDGKGNGANPMFDVDISPIGYQLRVINTSGLDNPANFFRGWQSSQRWLIGLLYNHHGLIKDIGKPFFSLRVCLGQ